MTRSLLFLMIGGLLASAASASAKPAPDLVAGRDAYVTNCARCHGDAGKGDGPDAARMIPRPRDFTTGAYKFRLTASGTPPTDEDVFRTISTGLAGTRMPGWEGLSEDTRWHLVAYLKSLAPNLAQAQPQPVASFGKDPGPKGADLAKGRKLYTDLGCAACHGAFGRADGPSAKTLADDWGQPIRPANLTHGWELRGGAEPRDLVARLMTGVDGTPMPSYGDAVPVADLWQLAYYLRSIQESARWNAPIIPTPAAALPVAPDDAMWATVPRADVLVWSNVYVDGAIAPTTVTWAMVQAAAAGDQLAIRIAWDDPSEDRGSPPDQLALAFKPAVAGREVGSLQSWPADAAHGGPGAPALDLTIWSAATGAARAAVAGSFDLPDTAESRPAQAHYEHGRWSLVITRPRPGAATPLALVIWDGGNGDTGRRRSVSSWMDYQEKENAHAIP
ncbi:MAG: c-type cytochrome [Candidatus Omnitrophica bacterium]|nr:c-type cytochrome [Candidatus Omnitrophota bacterium]